MEDKVSIEAEISKVEWLDSGAVVSDGWTSLEDTIEKTKGVDFLHAETVGYVVYEDEDIIIMAQTLDMDAEKLLNAQVIARDAVFNREEWK